MTHSTKNKIWIFIWVLTLGLLTYLLLNKVIPLWEKLLNITIVTLTGMLNISSRIRDNKDIRINNDTLFVKKTFSKEKNYCLKNILSWSEIHYSLFGVKTNSAIILKTESGEKINLYRKGTKNYQKLSYFLNEKLSNKHKNPH